MGGEYQGARIRYWRLKRGLSQRVLAGLAGMSQGYVSQIEAGIKEIDKRSTLIRLAGALQVSVADLTHLPGPDFPEMDVAEATISASGWRSC